MKTKRTTSQRAASKRRPVTARPTRRGTSRKRTRQTPRFEGEDHPAARLTEQRVRDLRAGRYDKITLHDLALRWGVAASTLTLASTGQTWRHLPGARKPLKPGHSLARPPRPVITWKDVMGKDGKRAGDRAAPRGPRD